MTKSDLQRAVGLGWGTVVYHVEQLALEERLDLQEDGSRVRVFPTDLSENERRWFAALRGPFSQQIVEQLAAGSDVLANDLAESFGVSRKVMRRHLSTLHEAGLLERDGHRTAYTLAERAKRFLQTAGHLLVW